MLRHLANLILAVLPPSRLFRLRVLLLRLAQVDVADSVCFCGRGWIFGRGRLTIGSGTWLSPKVVFFTHLDAPITIGRNCDVGHGVEFVPGGHEIGTHERRAGKGTARPIQIGDGCWIGARALILGGVEIGKGSVVAAGSVVISNVPEDSLVAGVPARIKRRLAP